MRNYQDTRTFLQSFFDKKIYGIVSHDVGGANQISAMLSLFELTPAWVTVSGPAERVFVDSIPFCVQTHGLDWLKEAEILVTGSGWSSDLEHKARLRAQKYGVYSVTLLDHWANYRQRFIRNNELVLPSELWVTDEYAFRRAKNELPEVHAINLETDFYLTKILKTIAPLTESTPGVLTYLCEPIRESWGLNQAGEHKALNFFFGCLHELRLDDVAEIQLRPHPSENVSKYERYLKKIGNIRVTLAEGDLSQCISRSRWVVGVQTYALVVALSAGRRVFSSLPPEAPLPSLPHVDIEYIRDFIKK
jgi:hypothetical protein